MRQIPHLPALTMCFWIQFLETNGDLAWSLVEYIVTGTRPQGFKLMWSPDGPNEMTMLINQLSWTGDSYLVQDRLESVAPASVA